MRARSCRSDRRFAGYTRLQESCAEGGKNLAGRVELVRVQSDGHRSSPASRVNALRRGFHLNYSFESSDGFRIGRFCENYTPEGLAALFEESVRIGGKRSKAPRGASQPLAI